MLSDRVAVYPFDPSNMYPASSALRVYQRRRAAEAYADKLNEKPFPPEAPRGYVVRRYWGPPKGIN